MLARREQYFALVDPRIPQAVEDEDCPVHRPVRQVDVEPAALGQPLAGNRGQFAGRIHQAAEGGAG
jgi:hypothetical protein